MLKLFIADQQVDFPESFSILFNHTLEDRTNPTVVKNSFSKTLELPGTDNNNRIFGTFFRNDRWQLYGSEDWGASFDPSKKVSFKIFENGDLIQDGYCKLDKVKRTGEQVLYYVSLYGGLGEFFYNLTYKSDGVEKKLSDLDFGQDLSFKINKENVQEAWNTLGTSTENKWQTINFAPTYNGVPEDFDAENVLINTAGSSLFTTSKTYSGKTYETRDGYMMGELGKAYDEWQIRDLRSYLQRPVIRVKKLLEACFQPVNNSGDTNSGYTVDLDADFFNSSNPYWEDAWIALPLLNTDNEDTLTTEPSRTTFNSLSTTSGVTGTTRIDVDGTEIASESGIVDLTDYPFSFVNVSVNLSLEVTGVTDSAMPQYPEFPDVLYMGSYSNWGLFGGKHRTSYGAVMAQLVAYDADTNKVIGGSDINAFFEPNYNDKKGRPMEVTVQNFVGDGAGKYQPKFNANYAPVRGWFVKKRGDNAHIFTDDQSGSRAWRISIDKCPKVNRMRFELRLNKAWCAVGDSPSGSGWDAAADRFFYGDPFFPYKQAIKPVIGFSAGDGNLSITAPSSVSSDTTIEPQRLLSTECTPADYLLSYSKMFGLYWFKDQYENKIYCRTRNNFFYPVVEYIDDLIDRSQPVEVTPFVFNHKWYSMTQETPDTFFSVKYKTDWGKTYGEQRINTSYNFDSETQEIFPEFPYQNAIMGRASSFYFSDYQDKQGNFVPCFFLDGWTGKLYDGAEEIDDAYSQNLVDWSQKTSWYGAPGFDWLPKACFYELDNNEHKPVDIDNVLLFYNGKSETPGHFWITDDNNYMVSLNDEVCWLYTERSTDQEGNVIALRADAIPAFGRYKMAGNTIVRSWDFGDPKELYVDNLTLAADSSVYNRFWKEYLEDQYSVNARVVTCYVLWDRIVKEELQRRFWFFDNSIWMLNRIIDYDLNSYKPTKCEFIKITDTARYTKAQIVPSTRFPSEYYDDPPGGTNKPPRKPSSGDGDGYDPTGSSICTVIEFQDILTKAYAVEAWDANGDGEIDVCEAASVPTLGTVFKGTGIEYFDEIVYFTGINGIEPEAFSGCTNLKHIILPDNIDYIGENAFKNCTDLEWITIDSTDPPVLGAGAFDNTNECPIYIDCNYLSDFIAQWPQYAHRFQCSEDTGSTLVLATAITLNASDFTDTGIASYTLEPSNANNYRIRYASMNPSIATIDDQGNLFAVSNGMVSICVYEDVAGLQDCKTIMVTKTPSGSGWIEVNPPERTVRYPDGQTTFTITTNNIV